MLPLDVLAESSPQTRSSPGTMLAASPPSGRELYSSFLWGDGRGGDEQDRSMQGRAFELRMGKEFRRNTRIDFVHYNEGHPQNNHRDGFALQGVYRFSPGQRFSLEFALGPYLGFNTTTYYGAGEQEAIQLNDKGVGVLASAGLLYYPQLLGKSAHLRLQYNHVEIPGSPHSDAILAGIGFDIAASPPPAENLGAFGVTALLSHFITNHAGTSPSQGFHLEISKEINSNFAISVGFLQEGSDELVERSGIPLQFWYADSIGSKWSLAAGAGPYFSRESGHDSIDVNGIISMEAKRQLPKGYSLTLRFNRIMDINSNSLVNQENDRDMFEIGLFKKLH